MLQTYENTNGLLYEGTGNLAIRRHEFMPTSNSSLYLFLTFNFYSLWSTWAIL